MNERQKAYDSLRNAKARPAWRSWREGTSRRRLVENQQNQDQLATKRQPLGFSPKTHGLLVRSGSQSPNAFAINSSLNPFPLQVSAASNNVDTEIKRLTMPSREFSETSSQRFSKNIRWDGLDFRIGFKMMSVVDVIRPAGSSAS